MDIADIELLSRYIDGDLDRADEQKLVGRLESEPNLRSRLEELQRLRSSLSSLAGREHAPVELDALIEPLRRARPEAVSARPWVRWLATAAVAVVGLTVIVEVNLRGSRQPTPDASHADKRQRSAEPTERFSLAPLPESSVPPQDQLLGVSERLLASPVPEVPIDDPPALQVLGPLAVPRNSDSPARNEAEEKDVPTASAAAKVGVADVATPPETRAESGHDEESLADSAPATTGEPAPAGVQRLRQSPPHRPWDGDVSIGQAQLYVFFDGKAAWQVFEPRTRCEPGRYAVRIRIAGGVVREVWPVGGATPGRRSHHLCGSELVRGLVVADVVDGEYSAEVVVEPRGAKKN